MERHGSEAQRQVDRIAFRPGRITDEQVDAYALATNAGNGGARLTIRAGLAAAYAQREREAREIRPARTTDRDERIRERTRDLLDEIVRPELHPINLDPYPGTIEDVADEIVRYVTELDSSGAARGLRSLLVRRLLGDKGPMPVPAASGCPESVWDGPYRMACGRGAPSGVCPTHGRFRDSEPAAPTCPAERRYSEFYTLGCDLPTGHNGSHQDPAEGAWT